ncbi:autotransporter outer membrane beta-barrel domain-containing protein [Sabulicella glaciei]|uniref:Autotransporter domain-containing protein n=1 Tax=Sabulicella glaciei TaxID=2984948 RepID=A0ABT3NVU2_9PROT|nr:autotransporter domain-containing protein [Roseococcus sp. MDT2-1-1]MCW8086003.1 autotransporter domain-containing protein [Roseococcus sp. MDT2-1-1]
MRRRVPPPALAFVLAASAASAQGWNLYDGSTASIFVPYHNAVTNGQLVHSPSLRLSFSGLSGGNFTPGAQSFTMDTGSMGLVASPDNFQPQAGDVAIGPGQLTYTSSGRINHGTWYLTRVNIHDAQGVAAVAEVPVLQVTEITCQHNARECTATTVPSGVAMMGVGFAREADQQQGSRPRDNALINIVQMRGPNGLDAVAPGSGYTPGYVVTRGGVTLGLTPADTAGAAFARLLPNPAIPGEWMPATGGTTVNGVAGQGNSLVDTGVNEMFLVPGAAAGFVAGQAVPAGTRIAVSLPGLGAAGLASYGFTVGGGSALEPSAVIIPHGTSPFVNTGRYALNAFDVIFDSGNGFIGYRRAAGATEGQVTPGFVLQGSWQLPGLFLSSLPVVLAADTALASAGTAGLTGGISGPHALTLSGGGTFNLAGRGTYSGGTAVGPGTGLAISAGNELGSGPLTLDGGRLIGAGAFTLPNAVALTAQGGTVQPGGRNVALTGNLSGAGQLTVSGTGQVTLSGANTQAGGTLVRGGAVLATASDLALGAAGAPLTLNGGTLKALADLAILRPVSATNGSFDTTGGFVIALRGAFTHDGALSVLGDGRLDHAGDAVSASPVTLGGGRLSVSGSLTAPALLVAPGATLGGTGTVNAPTAVAGTLDPGNSPGTLVFSAPVTMLPGSVLAVELDGTGTGNGAGQFDRVVVQGGGFAAAGTVAPALRGLSGATNGFTPALGQGFTIVQADGGISGQFTAVAQPASGTVGTRFDLLYAPNSVTLLTTPAAYGALRDAGLPQTANQAAAGAALDAFRPAAGPRLSGEAASVFGPLYALAPSVLPATLEALAGTSWGDGLAARLSARQAFTAGLSDQLALARGTGDARAAQGVALGPERAAWFRALGQPMLRAGRDGAPGFTAGLGGVAAGTEIRLGAGTRAGVAVGYTSGVVTTRAGARIEGEALNLALYGGWTGPRGVFVEGDAGGGWARDASRRVLAAFGRQARGAAEGGSLGAGLRAGVAMEAAGWRLEPSLALRLDRVDRAGATETGAGSLGLRVQGGDMLSVRSVLGMTVSRRLDLPWDGMSVAPSLRAGWAHEFADASATTRAALLGAPDAGFRVASTRLGRDAALLGAGVRLSLRPGVSLFLDYASEWRSNLSAQTVSGGVRMSF